MEPLRSARGQSTLEYVGVVLLVAVSLAFAAPAVGAPDIPRAVAAKIRLGICVVVDDVCTPAAARAAGLEPCVVDGREDGHSAEATFVLAGGGLGAGWTGARASDGSFTLVHHFDAKAGVEVGAGTSAGGVLRASAEAQAGVDGAASVGYRFADEAALERFLAMTPLQRVRVPVQWRALAVGVQAEAEAKLAIEPSIKVPLGRSSDGTSQTGTFTPKDFGDLASGKVAGFATAETRFGPGDELTIKGRLRIDGPSGKLAGVGAVDAGSSTWSVALTRVDGESRRLVLQRESSASGGKRATLDTATLDLRDPADRAVANALVRSSPGEMSAALAAALGRAEATGHREVAVYDLTDTSSTIGADIALPFAKFGVEYAHTRTSRHLATAVVRDGTASGRERFDCLTAAQDGGRALTP